VKLNVALGHKKEKEIYVLLDFYKDFKAQEQSSPEIRGSSTKLSNFPLLQLALLIPDPPILNVDPDPKRGKHF
jgi:hypothetical protein